MPQQTGKQQEGKTLAPKVIKALAQSEELKLLGKHNKALEVAQKILIEDPTCSEAAEEVADNLLSLDLLNEAEKAALHALKLNPRSYIGHFVMGFASSEEENWKGAIKHFQISNEGQPNNPEILRCLGWALFHHDARSEGIATLQRALHLRNDDPAILCDLAACYLQTSSFNKAISLLEKAMEVDAGDPRVQDLFDVANRLQEAFSREVS